MKLNEFLRGIRRELHKAPETSGNEGKTASVIVSFLEEFEPTRIVSGFSENAVAAVYESGKPGATVVLRAELDGLPITEKNTFNHASRNRGASHACGHDGHMAMLLGVASYLHDHPGEIKARIVLLFEPAEEIAAGAKGISRSRFYEELKADYIFALHNLPGFNPGDIVMKKGLFAIASKGIVVELKGATAHAGHPEQGNNPVFAMTEIIENIKAISESYNRSKKQAMITIIHIRLGEIAFGSSPGTGVIMATLRAPTDGILNEMGGKVTQEVSEIAARHRLTQDVEWVEEFPATINDAGAVSILELAAKKGGMNVTWVEEPFSWTEDFSYFLNKTTGAMFGLGAGKDCPPLHSENYDFPDSILENGVEIFIQLIKEIDSST